MSFGRNPHVAKAETAEQKAQEAKDAGSYERAWRDAAHCWDRAAARESDSKRKATYAANAERARTTADAPPPGADGDAPHGSDERVDPSMN